MRAYILHLWYRCIMNSLLAAAIFCMNNQNAQRHGRRTWSWTWAKFKAWTGSLLINANSEPKFRLDLHTENLFAKQLAS